MTSLTELQKAQSNLMEHAEALKEDGAPARHLEEKIKGIANLEGRIVKEKARVAKTPKGKAAKKSTK